ncbi:bifunctional diguanylate cyclase/phosphodiesterase [Thaumasiovibrio subtropicus]|uniref:bifunctional diguanylate cyclase/phosphodiesterase n=1 Tax=Thaumasiovibrio subtropicus TaxID=1891207 RepID=UPI000B34F502|nr:EAL domain-containing protein [Thaumasiovibrio subtropicus]
MKYPRLLPLRTAVMLPFVVLLVVTLGIIAAAQHSSNQRMLDEMSTRLLHSYADNITTELNAFLFAPFAANNAMRDSIERFGLHTQDSLEKLDGYLLNMYKDYREEFPQISVISYGTEDGLYLGYRINDDDSISLMLKDKRTDMSLNIYKGLELTPTPSFQYEGYDPTIRPWYVPAATYLSSKWSSIYTNADEKQEITITGSSPVFKDDKFAGVLATDIKLNHINRFLADHSISYSGLTYIMDHQGRLIASSKDGYGMINDGQRRHAKESNNAVIAATGAHIESLLGAPLYDVQEFDLIIDEKRFFNLLVPYKDSHGLNWYILVSISEKALLGEVPAIQRAGLASVAVFAVIGLLTALMLISRLTQPVIEIANAARRLADGSWEYQIKSNVRLKETAMLTSAFRDMSARLQHSFFTLRKQVLYDSLTELFSREGLLDEMRKPSLKKQYSALYLLDLNAFRSINDSLGHLTGDRLLVAIARRLKARLPTDVTLARIGGDEFAVFHPDLATPAATEEFARALVDMFIQPFRIYDDEVVIQISIGLVSGTLKPNTEVEWLRNASLALSKAKFQESSRISSFEPFMADETMAKTRLTTEMSRAIENHEFCNFYQPVVSLKDGCIHGAEALVRWQSPSRGLVPPGSFIPLAEENGMIVDIGRQVLLKACQDTQQNIDSGEWPQDFSMHVNLSVRQLMQSDFVEQLKDVIRQTEISPQSLTLEITESRLASNNSQMITVLHQIRRLGVKIAIDDFGTGYSSLAYLNQLPFNKVKIDRSFISDLNDDAQRRNIVSAIINMTKGFGAEIVAEGVETPAQAALLNKLGCHNAQGFLYSKPLPLSQWPTLKVNIGRISPYNDQM